MMLKLAGSAGNAPAKQSFGDFAPPLRTAYKMVRSVGFEPTTENYLDGLKGRWFQPLTYERKLNLSSSEDAMLSLCSFRVRVLHDA